jgi:hypothetical protein
VELSLALHQRLNYRFADLSFINFMVYYRYLLTYALLSSLLCVPPARAALPAILTLGDLEQVYDGEAKTPSVVTDPPNLNVTWRFVDPAAELPQPVTETVFRNNPDALNLSYQSLSFAGQQTWGFGDLVGFAGTARNLESVDAVMVTWSKAEDYPELAAADPSGWRHEVTLSVYSMDASGVLGFIGEVTREIFVPWRPLSLPNGDPYPHNGYAFTAHFDFPDGLALPEQAMFMIDYDTQNTGFYPIGTSGPYNQLNVAVGGSTTIGTDVDPLGALWVRSETLWSYPTTVGAPRFVIKANRIPEPGTSEPPVNAGTWQATARIDDPEYEGETSATFIIHPAPLPLINPSFEDNAVNDGAAIVGSMTGWTATGAAGNQDFSLSSANQVPLPTDGEQHAYTNGGASLRQLSSFIITAGVTYTLTVDVGQISDFSGSLGRILLFGSTSGIGTALSNTNGTAELSEISPASGGPYLLGQTVSYTALAIGDPFAGQQLGIALVGSSGIQVLYDNVRLTATAPTNTFVNWISDPAFGLAVADQDFDDDSDGDQLNNALEAWLGTHPGQFNAGLANISSIGLTTTFTHPQSATAPDDLTGYYQWSPNLTDWYFSGKGPDGGVSVTFSTSTTGTTTTVTATASEHSDRIFLRAGVRRD